ncbi:MAG: glutathione S-transferase family protein [Paracoccaceae bacterium]
MILIGQYDSPFVRRVGIALRLYDLPFKHRPWSVFGDANKIAELNPLIRVPTLVLDDGFVLTDSHMILDHLDHMVNKKVVMYPRHEPERYVALKVATLATGLADKAVSLFYERRLHDAISATWEARCQRQMGGVLLALEADRAGRAGPWWFGERLGHADIAVACALRFANDAHPGMLEMAACPALTAHCNALEAMPLFQEISQPFVPPA